jgi:2,3-bisphosphoglycerate-independent phosphoglycerate mutase
MAETEKYAHVTYFFNGGVEKPFPGEDRKLIPSPKVATYDLKPEMSAFEVTDELLACMGNFDLIILNFANPDMVGHTGVVEAGISAVETVDACCARIISKLLELDGKALVTADHGNCEQMRNPDGSPNTAHTNYLVHFITSPKMQQNSAAKTESWLMSRPRSISARTAAKDDRSQFARASLGSCRKTDQQFSI